MRELPSKFIAGRFWVPVKAEYTGENKIVFKFKFNRTLLEEVKNMEGARWNPDFKIWTVSNTHRNWFSIDHLTGKNPYAPYDAQLVDYTPTRPLYKHQVEMVRHGLTRHYCIFAVEMGCGKTLSAIEIIEESGFEDWLYIAPKSALASVKLEMIKWGAKVTPHFYTYDGLRKLIENWPSGVPAPRGVIFDESSKVKNPNAQRTKAALHLANAIREEHGREGFVILMSGSPAPKSPLDWWPQAEVACPGFLREGTYEKEKRRLAIIESRESATGGMFPHLVTWKDDPGKCNRCGQPKDHDNHKMANTGDDVFDSMVESRLLHAFEPSKNEIADLYERLSGLVLIQFKKDCLDLPEKQYRTIKVRPKQSILNSAKLITATAPSTILALTLLRQLSDGFQYEEIEAGTKECELCHGEKEIVRPMPDDEGEYVDCTITCPHCGGAGEVPKYKTETKEFPCPKIDALTQRLEDHEEDGRLVIYAGFTGSVDRICRVVQQSGWEYIRVDGRGWYSSLGNKSSEEMLLLFQDKQRTVEKLAFIGQPSAAGMGLTLTESNEIVYYSNDFNAESRIQSEDRIHRPGADINRGCIITDLVHLPTDEQVIDNLKKKRKLQNLSLGVFEEALTAAMAAETRKL